MILAVGIGFRIGAVCGGALVGVVAVALARTIPGRMGQEERSRAPAWWAAAIAIGVGFGWQAGTSLDSWALLPAYLAFGATTLAVTLTDLDHRLIPNRILFPGLAVAGPLLAVGALMDGSGGRLGTAIAASAAYFVFLFVVALVVPDGFGMGDVKLALLIGLFVGFVGWDALAVSVCVAILAGGVASVSLLLFTSLGRKAKFAYGPYMVFGAWVGLFWGSQIADWYLRS